MSLEKLSPCKVNLLLNILGRRADGFHELETILYPVRVFDRLSFARAGHGILGGHGGGDGGLMEAFVKAVATGDRSAILSGPDETLESHLMVFAAERSRHRGTVESL